MPALLTCYRRANFHFHPLAVEDCLSDINLLTVLTLVLASLTVITGVYGMNFEHMPELRWRIGYIWALVLMVVVPGAIVLWARKKKWL